MNMQPMYNPKSVTYVDRESKQINKTAARAVSTEMNQPYQTSDNSAMKRRARRDNRPMLGKNA